MRNIIIAIITLLLLGIAFFTYQYYQFSHFLDSLDECVMNAGPIYGDSISVNIENLLLEQEIEIPNGKLGFMNLSDSLAPKLIKFDANGQIIWSVEFRPDSLLGFPYERLSEMELITNEFENRLSFYNKSFGKPGNIYLTKDYNLKYMCLSPW